MPPADAGSAAGEYFSWGLKPDSAEGGQVPFAVDGSFGVAAGG